MGSALLGLGTSGTIGSPLLLLKPYDIATFVAAIAMFVAVVVGGVATIARANRYYSVDF